jgi:hypothetical protein
MKLVTSYHGFFHFSLLLLGVAREREQENEMYSRAWMLICGGEEVHVLRISWAVVCSMMTESKVYCTGGRVSRFGSSVCESSQHRVNCTCTHVHVHVVVDLFTKCRWTTNDMMKWCLPTLQIQCSVRCVCASMQMDQAISFRLPQYCCTTSGFPESCM